MPFSDDFGLIFNCGFYRTFVLECSIHQSDNGKKQAMGRKKKSANVVNLIYLCFFKVGPMDLGLPSGVTISVNMVNNDYLFSIVTTNNYTQQHRRTHSD